MVGHCQIDYLLVTSLENCLELLGSGLSSSADAWRQLSKLRIDSINLYLIAYLD